MFHDTKNAASNSHDTSQSNHENHFRMRFIYDFPGCTGTVQDSENTIKTFLVLLKERVLQERKNSSLVGIIDTFATHSPDKDYIGYLKPLASILAAKATQNVEFTEGVTEDIIKPLELIKSQHSQITRELEQEGTTLCAQYQSYTRSVREIRNSITRANERYQSALINLKESKHLSPDIRVKLYLEAGTASSSSHHLTGCLRDSLVKRDKFITSEYMEKMPTILNMYEDIVRERLDLVKSCIQKYIVFEMSYCRGIQYELENNFKSLAEFCPILVPPGSGGNGHEPQDTPSQINKEPILLDIGTDEKASRYGKEILADGDLDVNLLESLRKSATSSSYDRIRILNGIIQSLPNPCFEKNVHLSNLGRILWVLLDTCELGGKGSAMIDSDCARRICSLGRRFFTVISDRKKFLQAELYDHAIWNRVAFWEESLIITVSEELIGNVNTCDMTIDTMGHYMLMFGLSSTAAVNICTRVLNEYFASLSQNQNLAERLSGSIRVAQERQNRNIASLTASPDIGPSISI